MEILARKYDRKMNAESNYEAKIGGSAVRSTAEPPIFTTFTPFPGGEGVAPSWQVERCIELVEMPVETLSKCGRGDGAAKPPSTPQKWTSSSESVIY